MEGGRERGREREREPKKKEPYSHTHIQNSDYVLSLFTLYYIL
jgi:hypothetical protein